MIPVALRILAGERSFCAVQLSLPLNCLVAYLVERLFRTLDRQKQRGDLVPRIPLAGNWGHAGIPDDQGHKPFAIHYGSDHPYPMIAPGVDFS